MREGLEHWACGPNVKWHNPSVRSVDNAVASGLRLTQQGLEFNESLSLLEGDVLLRCVAAAEGRWTVLAWCTVL